MDNICPISQPPIISLANIKGSSYTLAYQQNGASMNRQYFEWKSLQLMLSALRNEPRLFKWDGISKDSELTAIGSRMSRADRVRLLQIFPKKDPNDNPWRDKT
ncbi:MAG: hypothetical protein EOP04_28405, partial [Proteobacteria bacterium]